MPPGAARGTSCTGASACSCTAPVALPSLSPVVALADASPTAVEHEDVPFLLAEVLSFVLLLLLALLLGVLPLLGRMGPLARTPSCRSTASRDPGRLHPGCLHQGEGPQRPRLSIGIVRARTCSAPVAASQAELTNPAWISQSLLEGGLKATGHPRPGVDSRQIRDARELGLRGVHLGHRPALRGDLLLSVGLEPTVCLKE